MAQIVWTEPAISDLDAIGDYIALQNPDAAAMLVTRIFEHVGRLVDHPESGSKLSELKRSRYRQIVEPTCRIVYRFDGKLVIILHVMRSQQFLRPARLSRRPK
jgi:toxin ParE1/3/4